LESDAQYVANVAYFLVFAGLVNFSPSITLESKYSLADKLLKKIDCNSFGPHFFPIPVAFF